MTTYNFYAEPKNSDDLIVITANPSIHTLKFILIDNGKYSSYKLVNEPLIKECFVEEHHCYKILRMGWTHNSKDGWYNEDSIPFSIIINPNNLIKGLKEFYNKPFNTKQFINKLKLDSDFKYIIEEIFGNDIDYVDMYFDMNENWSLTKIEVKEIRTITYKNNNED